MNYDELFDGFLALLHTSPEEAAFLEIVGQELGAPTAQRAWRSVFTKCGIQVSYKKRFVESVKWAEKALDA